MSFRKNKVNEIGSGCKNLHINSNVLHNMYRNPNSRGIIVHFYSGFSLGPDCVLARALL